MQVINWYSQAVGENYDMNGQCCPIPTLFAPWASLWTHSRALPTQPCVHAHNPKTYLDCRVLAGAQLCLDDGIRALGASAASLPKLIDDGGGGYGLHPTVAGRVEGAVEELFDEGVSWLEVEVREKQRGGLRAEHDRLGGG